MEEKILCPLLRRRILRLQDDGICGRRVGGEAEQLHRGGMPDHDSQQTKAFHLHHSWSSGLHIVASLYHNHPWLSLDFGDIDVDGFSHFLPSQLFFLNQSHLLISIIINQKHKHQHQRDHHCYNQLTSVVERMFSVESEPERQSWVEAIEGVKEVVNCQVRFPDLLAVGEPDY